jgi:hypothetical protein
MAAPTAGDLVVQKVGMLADRKVDQLAAWSATPRAGPLVEWKVLCWVDRSVDLKADRKAAMSA